jgi:hypothetical protein
MLLQVSFQLGDKVDVALGVLMSEEETTVSLGIHIQETTMEDMFKQMDKVIPGSNVANETESNEEKPELGMLIVIIQYVLIALLFILEKCIGALRDM